MTVGTVKTQGTHLYLLDNVSQSEPVMIKFACPTGISGLGGPKDQIEDTCLDALVDKTFVGGLGNPGQVTVPFNLIPREASHQLLFDLKESGDVLKWIACLSESQTPPTIDSGAGEFEPPADRTSFQFDAYISDVNIDIATNEIVRGTLILQRSGVVTPTWYEPVEA